MSKNNADLLRARLRAGRRAMSVAQRQCGNQLLCQQLQDWLDTLELPENDRADSLTVAAFWPLEDEPDLTPLLRAWDAVGINIVLPVVIRRQTPLEFHRWDAQGVPCVSGAFGVREPPRLAPLQPDVVLVPTLGYTLGADRLGYGAGYYDRTLHAMQQSGHKPVSIGIAWDEGLLEAYAPHYAAQPHDMPLDAVLTPAGWIPSRPTRISAGKAATPPPG